MQVPVIAEQFLNIDTAQSELDRALNGGPFPPGGGISGIDVPGGDVPAQTHGSGTSVAPQQSGDAQIMGQLRITAVNAQSLPIVDSDDGCDPYVEIAPNGAAQKAEVQKDTLVSTLNKSFNFKVYQFMIQLDYD